jgi:hypothetical protein
MPSNERFPMTRLLSLLTVAAACTASSQGSVPDHTQAKHAYSAMSTRIDAALQALDSHVAPLSGAVSITEPCSLGGDLGLAGTYEASSNGVSAFDLTAGFDACQEADGSLDGSLHWIETTGADSVTDSWQGTLVFTDASGVWQCVFDYGVTAGAQGTHYTGSICGFDVNADLDLP